MRNKIKLCKLTLKAQLKKYFQNSVKLSLLKICDLIQKISVFIKVI